MQCGAALWWSVNQCYDQYITDKLMGNEAGVLVFVFWCSCVVICGLNGGYVMQFEKKYDQQ